MGKAKDAPTPHKEPAPLEQPQRVDHSERIRSQVLAKTGKPPRLTRVEVSEHHNGNYRVNIWQQPESDKDITTDPRIGASYYLKVSKSGEITHSNPPLTKLGFLA